MPVAGSSASQLPVSELPVQPTATSTFPLGSKTGSKANRAVIMLAVEPSFSATRSGIDLRAADRVRAKSLAAHGRTRPWMSRDRL